MINSILSDIKSIYGDTQSDIADKIGKSRQRITDLKSGLKKINLEEVRRLMREYPELNWVEILTQDEN